MSRPRLLVLSRNLPPLRGGMERLSLATVRALQEVAACHVIGPAGCDRHLPPGVTVEACRSAGAAGYLVEAALRVLRGVLTAPRPHLVLACSGLTAPLAWLYARLRRCPYAVVVHGLDIIAPSRVYQALFVPRLRGAATVIANSRNTAELAVAHGVARTRIRIVHPAIEWPMELPSPGDFRARHDLGDGPVLLAVGRLTARKGVAEFVARCLPDLLAARPELRLVVIGGEAGQAIRREVSTRAGIAAAAARAGTAHALRLLGEVDDEVLAQAYASADLHVFPLVAVPGDVEGFGMVAAEAAAHGVLSVAFAEGGVVDAVQPGVTGELVAGGDYAALTRTILEQLPQAREPGRRQACREAARRFGESQYAPALREALQDLLPPAGSEP